MGSADEGVMPQQRSEELSHRVARRSFYIVIRSLAPRRPPGPTPRGRQILGRPIIASTRRKWLPTVGPFRAVRGLNAGPGAGVYTSILYVLYILKYIFSYIFYLFEGTAQR